MVQALDNLGVEYIVVGSVASSLAGEPRTTHDVDIVASMHEAHAAALVEHLGADYYADLDTIRDEIARGGMFNLVHLSTMVKVVIFVDDGTEYSREQMRRRRTVEITVDGDPFAVYASSPEDVVLARLTWFRRGQEVSIGQWCDMLGVLKVQRTSIDLDYPRTWAQRLRIADLLHHALLDAGFIENYPY